MPGPIRRRTLEVVFHRPFEAHRDEFGRTGAVVLDLPLSRCPAFTTGELDAIDAVVRLAERDPQADADLLLEEVRLREAELADWPDALTRAVVSLAGCPPGRLRANSADRWRRSDDGIHVLGNLEAWLSQAAAGGRLAPERLHAMAARVVERRVSQLWPLDADAGR